jgi:hypothetical protein
MDDTDPHHARTCPCAFTGARQPERDERRQAVPQADRQSLRPDVRPGKAALSTSIVPSLLVTKGAHDRARRPLALSRTQFVRKSIDGITVEAEMNTYALESAANHGARLHGASMSRRAIAQVCPPSSRSRADGCRPTAANSFASCRDVQRSLRSENASRPVGNVFGTRRPTHSTAMPFGRSPENSVGRSPAPKVLPLTFSFSTHGMAASLERRGGEGCQHCWHAAGAEPELVWGGGSLSIHGVPWSAKSRQNEIAISSQHHGYCPWDVA